MAKSILKLGGEKKGKKGINPLIIIGAAVVGLVVFMRGGGDDEEEGGSVSYGVLAEEIAQRFAEEQAIFASAIEDINERIQEISDREDSLSTLPYEPAPTKTIKKSTSSGSQGSTGYAMIPQIADTALQTTESPIVPSYQSESVLVGPLNLPLSLFPADVAMQIAAGAPVTIKTDPVKTSSKASSKKTSSTPAPTTTSTPVKATAETAAKAEKALKEASAAGKTTVTVGPLVLPTSLLSLPTASPTRSEGRSDVRYTTTEAGRLSAVGILTPKKSVDIYAKAGTVGH